MPGPPCGGELRRRLVLERAVRAMLVVVHAPGGYDRARLGQ